METAILKLQKFQNKLPQSRVELHCHLDGAVRPTTIYELAKQKQLPLPGDGSLEDLRTALVATEPTSLAQFLSHFKYIMFVLIGDVDANERIAYEFCEDKSLNGVLYVEARFSPFLLVHENEKDRYSEAKKIVDAVLRGFKRGEKDFHITVRTILTCIRGRSADENRSVVDLVHEYRGRGVVAIDVAGDEVGETNSPGELDNITEVEGEIFQRAKRLGLHRTVHAGEVGPARMVELALDKLHAERIGHGYHVLEDEQLYKRCIRDQVHLECCPWSSLLTGAVPLDTTIKHPIVQFAEDGVNFSINTDDPTVTGRELECDYQLVRTWGLTEAQMATVNFNAARSSFLPEPEKQQLLAKLRQVYGMWEE